jgi:hypothetical protein
MVQWLGASHYIAKGCLFIAAFDFAQTASTFSSFKAIGHKHVVLTERYAHITDKLKQTQLTNLTSIHSADVPVSDSTSKAKCGIKHFTALGLISLLPTLLAK